MIEWFTDWVIGLLFDWWADSLTQWVTSFSAHNEAWRCRWDILIYHLVSRTVSVQVLDQKELPAFIPYFPNTRTSTYTALMDSAMTTTRMSWNLSRVILSLPGLRVDATCSVVPSAFYGDDVIESTCRTLTGRYQLWLVQFLLGIEKSVHEDQRQSVVWANSVVWTNSVVWANSAQLLGEFNSLTVGSLLCRGGLTCKMPEDHG